MSRKLFIHIGTHKTGSTSIQAFLRKNTSILSGYDMHVPAVGTLGPASGHHNIAWHVRNEPRFKPELGGVDELLLDLQKCSLSKAVISAEDFEYCAHYPEAIKEFEQKLNHIGWETEYVTFFRRQDKYAESLYATLLPFGLSLSYKDYVEQILRERSFCMRSDWFFNFDFQDFCQQWISIVGPRLIVESYDDAVSTDGILATFVRALGVSDEWVDEGKTDRLNVRRGKQNTPEKAALAARIREEFHESNLKLKEELSSTTKDMSALVLGTDPANNPNPALELKLQQTVAQVMQQAFDHHSSGQLADAEKLYHEIIDIQPNHPDANHNLGVLIAQAQQPSVGLPFLKTALEAQPENEQYWLSYVDALIRDDQLEVAAETLELGRKHGLQGEKVEKLSERLLGQKQSTVQVNDEREGCSDSQPAAGLAEKKPAGPSRQDIKKLTSLQRKGKIPAIEAFARDLIARFPEHGLGWKILGTMLTRKDAVDEALQAMQRAAELLPEDPQVFTDLAELLRNKGRLAQAEENFKKALNLDPELFVTLNNYGNLLRQQSRYTEAEEYFQKALKHGPKAAVHNNLGATLLDDGRIVESEACFRQALKITPGYDTAQLNLGVSLRKQGRLVEAIEQQRQAVRLDPANTEHLSNLLFTLNYSSNTAKYFLKEAEQFGRIVAKKVKDPFSSWQCEPQPERLRVGFLSGDLHNHPVGFFLESILGHLDSRRIELIAYPTNPKADDLTARIKPLFSAWKPLFGLSDEATARKIHDDGVHVLFDLSGHTSHNRLSMMVWKPAPVQASWLGYFATTGVEAVDYFLADEVGVPASQQDNFTETIWYLPETRLCFSAPLQTVSVSPLPALTNGYITFGCFQQYTKVGDDVIKLWGEVLKELPDARFRWQCTQLGDPKVVEQLHQRLQKNGIDPARVETHGQMPREAYLSAHAEVDLLLDSFPYPGGTTTCEALWTGVPTLTLAGESLLSRQGASLLTAAGLQDWIATSKEEYVTKAIAMASDLERLSGLRAKLREQVLASPLFDAERFARNFEDAIWGMWEEKRPQEDRLIRPEQGESAAAPVEEDKPIMNFFNPIHWGTKDPALFNDLMRKAAEQTTAYHYGDNMFVFQRNNSMLNDQPFMQSWKENAITPPDQTIIWRRYILAMAAFHCQHLEGDFVECGAYQGVGAKTVIDYLGGKDFPKTFWLYDLFEHNEKMVNHSMQAHGPQLHTQVVKRFKDYPNVKIFKGFLPDVLEEGAPEKIAYLHLDLNQAPAEIATLDALFDRVVPGGMIILDDYEMVFYRAQKLAEDTWFGKRGYKVFPLPTSQGFVIKR